MEDFDCTLEGLTDSLDRADFSAWLEVQELMSKLGVK
jgi:hypothetical protein